MTASNPAVADTAVELRQKIAKGSLDPNDYSALANLAFEAGRYDEAVSLLQRALSLNLTKLEKGRTCWELAWLSYALKRPEQALEQAEIAQRFLSAEPESPEVLFLQATAESLWAQCSPDPESSQNVVRSALRKLSDLIAKAPNFENIAFAYAQAARLHDLLGNADEAAKLCEECLQKDLEPRERLDCLFELAEARHLAGRYSEAEHALAEALRYAEFDKARLPELYSTLGVILYASNRPEEAREAFQKTLTEVEAQPYLPDNPTVLKEVYWNLGQVYYDLGDHEKAIVTLRKLLPLYPEDDLYRRNVLVWLGQSYHESKNFEEALGCYQQVLNSPQASESEKASTQQGLGKIYFDLGDYDEAVSAFKNVVSYFSWDDSFYADSLLWLGGCYEAKGEYETASECYKNIVRSRAASEKDRALAQQYLAQLPEPFRITLQ